MLNFSAYQDQLLAVILTQPADVGVRTDVLAKATGTTTRDVPASLLRLREQGLIASVNDGSAYNSWHTTPKLRQELARRHTQRGVAVAYSEVSALAAKLAEVEKELKAEQEEGRLFERKLAAAYAELRTAQAENIQLKGQLAAATKGTYVLWNPASKIVPSVTYPTLAEGRRVAEIMARRSPDESFNLCKLVEKFKFVAPKPQPNVGLTVEKL